MTTIQRPLPDGASYELCSWSPGNATMTVVDLDGDRAVVTFDRTVARQLIEDVTLIAGLVATAPTVGPAAALAGAVRRNFELLRELERIDPAAADQIAIGIAHHLRSWKPMVLTATVTP